MSDFPDVDDTAYALLFLSYGSAPVVFNKLAYGEAAQWNSRPRDLARLTTWMGKTYERLFNWQVMPIDRPLSELADAPILLMSGRGAIELTGEQKAKLKQYVLSGGLLLGEAAGGSATFIRSFRALVGELFPELELRRLEKDHPIYTVQFRFQKLRPGQLAPPPLEGLSNGVRTMVLLCPSDLGCAWQRYDVVRGRSSFELGANLAQYVSDRGAGLVGRGSSYLVADQGRKPAKAITVGRVVWGNKYNWDPEPYAWTNVDVRLRNAEAMGVSTQEADLAAAVDPKAVPILHLTGVGPLSLSDGQKAALKRYVGDGGLLLVDAAGGSPAFVESFQKLAGELFGPLAPATAPFAESATQQGQVWMRHVDRLPRARRPLELLGWQRKAGDWGVLFLPYDLTAALAGYANVEPAGLAPDSAELFIDALLKWRLGG